MRPAELIEAQAHYETGDLDVEELREIGNVSNPDVACLKDDAGLEVMTDSVYHRNTYFLHFFERTGSLEFDRNAEQAWDNANDKREKVGAEIAKLKLVVKTAEEV